MEVHISGCDNVEVDHLLFSSRESSSPGALHRIWSLDSGIANLLFGLWGVLMVDLFATGLNKVEAFYSRIPDSLTLKGTPLQVDWSL